MPDYSDDKLKAFADAAAKKISITKNPQGRCQSLRLMSVGGRMSVTCGNKRRRGGGGGKTRASVEHQRKRRFSLGDTSCTAFTLWDELRERYDPRYCPNTFFSRKVQYAKF
jgi:hypothetical protein